MDEQYFRPLFCTVNAELGQGQWDEFENETLPQCSIDIELGKGGGQERWVVEN